MPSIHKTTTGYRAQIYVAGVRESKSFRTQREAIAWAARRESDIREEGKKTPGERCTLADLLRRYSLEVSPTKRGRKWEQLRLERFATDVHLPTGAPVADLTPEHIAAWRDVRKTQVGAGTVIRELGLLSAVLEHARREWRLLSANPCSDVRKPRAPDHRDVVISWRQIRAMCRAMGYRSSGRITETRQAVAVCFLVALRSGMRAGELSGLTWPRVFADYCATPHKTGNTAESLRLVPLEPRARALIERMRGWDEFLVFGLRPASLDALFRKYRDRAVLTGFTFHDARHTAATLLSRRVDVLTLCKIFGWSSTTQALTYFNPTASSIATRLAQRTKPGRPH
nr:tyrosine-type recombinase/integrase [Zoogloeaceae bacterium]